MDAKRKKEMIEAYKNRCPEMGLIAYRCKETGETFLGISKDTRADFNSNTVKLAANYHPNRRMQELWNTYGQDGFEIFVQEVLKYKDPHEDHTKELEELRELCFLQDPEAKKIWK